jgi:hypothetical protein
MLLDASQLFWRDHQPFIKVLNGFASSWHRRMVFTPLPDGPSYGPIEDINFDADVHFDEHGVVVRFRGLITVKRRLGVPFRLGHCGAISLVDNKVLGMLIAINEWEGKDAGRVDAVLISAEQVCEELGVSPYGGIFAGSR